VDPLLCRGLSAQNGTSEDGLPISVETTYGEYPAVAAYGTTSLLRISSSIRLQSMS
jgi:ABC-type sulfate transport system permease subunit